MLRRFFCTSVKGDKSIYVANVKKQIDQHKVLLYTKSTCGYCRAAIELLQLRAAPYHNIDLNREEAGMEMQRALREITGQNTVPNIFINSNHIGGYTQLKQLEDTGELDDIFKEAGIEHNQ